MDGHNFAKIVRRVWHLAKTISLNREISPTNANVSCREVFRAASGSQDQRIPLRADSLPRQGVEVRHDVYCSECGLLALSAGDDREGGQPDIYKAGVSIFSISNLSFDSSLACSVLIDPRTLLLMVPKVKGLNAPAKSLSPR